MRIAIDARLNAYRRGGIPQYTRQLLTALADIALEEQLISLQHRDMLRPLAVAPNVSRRTVYTPPHHRFESWTLPLEVSLVRPDVLHFPDFVAPVFRPCPAVVTIHDLAFMHYPKILDDSGRAYYSQVVNNTPRADAVIAVSEATRQDVAQFLDIPIENIHVIYEAAAPMFRRMDLRPGEARVLNGKPVAAGTFMLFVSTLEPRKNLPTLLQALRICIDRRPERPYKLVIVGGRGWNDEPIFDAIRDLQLSDHLLLAGSVGQYDLRWLYNACQFYINPSLYEGFGLPLLEAMACGAACLAAATSSLPEIGGDAAVYVPPLEPDQWADAIEALWDNTERQQELGRIGQARSQRFSWTRAARETLKVYYQVVERRGQAVPARPSAGPPVRRTALPPQPAVVLPVPGVRSDGARTCLRCATPMLPGELQQHLRIQLASDDGSEMPVQPRAWACPNCGYAELVVEPLVVSFADAVAAMPDEGVPAKLLLADAELAQEEVAEEATLIDNEVPEIEAPVLELQEQLAAATDEDAGVTNMPHVTDEPSTRETAVLPALAAEDAGAPDIIGPADEPSVYATAVLPALDRYADEDAEPVDALSLRETAVLPALDRNATNEEAELEVAATEDELADDARAVADDAVTFDESLDAALNENTPKANGVADEQEPAVEREHVQTMPVEDDDFAEIAETEFESAAEQAIVEPEPVSSETTRLGDGDNVVQESDARDVYDLTPVDGPYVNGVVPVEHSSSQHDSRKPKSSDTNGQHLHVAQSPKARPTKGKRSITSAKLSRAAARQHDVEEQHGTSTPRRKA